MARSSGKQKRSPKVGAVAEAQTKRMFSLENWQLVLLRVAVIAVAGLWIYWPALYGDWISDDIMYVSQNPLLRDPARLWKAWFAPGSFIEYYPIEEWVRWGQWQLWHQDTFGYHLTNVVLHVINALLVWRLLSKFGLRFAWLGGLIFAIHPMQVESVAWISELKNTLSLPPLLLALCFLIDYEENRNRNDYFLALGLFLVAMLCKVSMAPVPFVILLYAWWKRGRIVWSDLQDSVPFFAISFVLGMTAVFIGTWYLQIHHESPDVVPIDGFFSRLAMAGLTT